MNLSLLIRMFFFFNDTATTEIYTLSLHDALPIFSFNGVDLFYEKTGEGFPVVLLHGFCEDHRWWSDWKRVLNRKSTRLNSSHSQISYAVFCLKKKNRTMALTPHHAATSVLYISDA